MRTWPDASPLRALHAAPRPRRLFSAHPLATLVRQWVTGLLALLAWLALLGLAGCQTLYPLPQVDVVLPTASLPLPPTATAPSAAAGPADVATTTAAAAPNGAIFRADTYRPLFENHRARLVGDTLLVQIAEKVSAVQRSSSQVDRTGTVAAGLTAVPLLSAASLAKAAANGSGSNTFAGKGSTENSNDFSGSVTVSVVQVLPNGHLMVAGEKQIGVNANVDVLRFSGQVDPRAITPGNTVASTQVANVRIEQRGRGQQADAQSVGWLGRFFMNVLPL